MSDKFSISIPQDEIDDNKKIAVDASVDFLEAAQPELKQLNEDEELVEGLSPWASAGPEIMEITFSMATEVSVGVIASYLCEELREQNITKIRGGGGETVEVTEERLQKLVESSLNDAEE